MKRKKQSSEPVNKYIVKTIKPWFWKQCYICHDEMKKEPVYKISIDWYEKRPDNSCTICCEHGYEIDTYYFCNVCCPTIEDAKTYFEENLLKIYKRRT